MNQKKAIIWLSLPDNDADIGDPINFEPTDNVFTIFKGDIPSMDQFYMKLEKKRDKLMKYKNKHIENLKKTNSSWE